MLKVIGLTIVLLKCKTDIMGGLVVNLNRDISIELLKIEPS